MLRPNRFEPDAATNKVFSAALVAAIWLYLAEHIGYLIRQLAINQEARLADVMTHACLAASSLAVIFVILRDGRWIKAALIWHFLVCSYELTLSWQTLANHQYLHYFMIASAASTYLRSSNNASETLAIWRWLAITVFVGSALQKLAHGAWASGAFINLQVAVGDSRFLQLFHILGLDSEIARLQAMGGRLGSASYDSQYFVVVALANSVILIEMMLPCLLIPQQTQRVAATALIVFVLAMQIFMLELFFALHMVNLLLLFKPRAHLLFGVFYWPTLFTSAVLAIWRMLLIA